MDTYMVLALCLALACPNSGYVSDSEDVKATFEKALEICKSRDAVLYGAGKEHDKMIENLSIYTHVDDAWVNIKIRRYGRLTWLDGSPVDDRAFNLLDAKCGVIDVSDKRKYELPCTHVIPGALCQQHSCSRCPTEHTNCFTMGGICYYVNRSDLNWYGAQNKCSLHGRNLATPQVYGTSYTVEDYIRFFSLSIRDMLHPHYQNVVLWIGSRTVDWFPGDTETHVQTYRWLDHHPQYDKDCVVLAMNNGRFGWKSYSCKANASVLCFTKEGYLVKFNRVPGRTTTTHMPSEPEINDPDRRDTNANPLVSQASRHLLMWHVAVTLPSVISQILWTVY